VGFLCGVLLIVVLAVAGGDRHASRTTTGRTPTVVRIAVPDVVGQRLDVARDRLEREGFAVKRSGGGLFGVVVESNWQVRAQTPAGGTQLVHGARVELFVDRP
jgi:beta-lactam-binding protein with PASTA domain